MIINYILYIKILVKTELKKYKKLLICKFF